MTSKMSPSDFFEELRKLTFGLGWVGSRDGQNSDPRKSKKQKRVILKKCVFAGQNLVPRRQNRIESDGGFVVRNERCKFVYRC